MRLLLEAGADPTAEDAHEMTAYDLAEGLDNDNIKRLLKGSNSQLSTCDENIENSI